MELGNSLLNIFISAGLLFCALVAAVTCDLLKRKHDQLRDLQTELSLRSVLIARKEQRLARALAATSAGAQQPVAAVDCPPVQRRVQHTSASKADVLALITGSPKAARQPWFKKEGFKKERFKKEGFKNNRERSDTPSPATAGAIERGRKRAADSLLAGQPNGIEPASSGMRTLKLHIPARLQMTSEVLLDPAAKARQQSLDANQAAAQPPATPKEAAKIDWRAILSRKTTGNNNVAA